MRRPGLFYKLPDTDQKGLASFVIVGVLVILLTLISIGFSKIMDRAQNNSLNNQLSSAASYAAQSALKDVSSYVVSNPKTNSTGCTPLDNGFDKGLTSTFNAGNLSADPSRTASYTCLLVDNSPPDLVIQQIPPDKSEVVNLDPGSGRFDQIMFSWQGSTPANRNFPAGTSNGLTDETTWNTKGFTPVLRITLYPVKGQSIDTANSRTFFLYPYDGGATLNVPALAYAGVEGQLLGVPCNTNGTRNTGSFQGTADYDCTLIISNISGAGSPVNGAKAFYARLTPLYAGADIKIKANDNSAAGGVVKFQKSQSVVDVTARDGTAVKRLQARIDISSSSSSGGGVTPGSNNIPEFGLQTSNAVCKRFIIDSAGNLSAAPTGTACNASGVSPSAQCSDGKDNDGDGKIDQADPGCHTDCNASNAASYDATDNTEADSCTPPTQCSDGIDNDGDGKIDQADPGCHTNCNAKSAPTYDPTINNEANPCKSGGGTQPPIVVLTNLSLAPGGVGGNQILNLTGTVQDFNVSGTVAWFHYIECGSGAPYALHFYGHPGQPQSVPSNNSTNTVTLAVNPFSFFYCGFNDPSSFQICAQNSASSGLAVCSNVLTINSSGGTGGGGGGGGGGGTPVCSFNSGSPQWTSLTPTAIAVAYGVCTNSNTGGIMSYSNAYCEDATGSPYVGPASGNGTTWSTAYDPRFDIGCIITFTEHDYNLNCPGPPYNNYCSQVSNTIQFGIII